MLQTRQHIIDVTIKDAYLWQYQYTHTRTHANTHIHTYTYLYLCVYQHTCNSVFHIRSRVLNVQQIGHQRFLIFFLSNICVYLLL